MVGSPEYICNIIVMIILWMLTRESVRKIGSKFYETILDIR
jgi:hypothetical protein